MTASICKYQLQNEYAHTMLQCVRCDLKNEIKACKTCKINNNKLKKANKIFPDAIVDLINSFNVCKRCMKTIDLLDNEPEDMNIKQVNLWYFVKLNPLPSMTTLNKQLKDIYQLERCTRSNWRCGVLNDYDDYKNWFNELWKTKTVSRLKFETMLNILRIMFNINGYKHKLEYTNVSNKDFFKDNIFNYILKLTIIRTL